MKDYREQYRRQHRVVGMYLAIQAWIRGADGLAVDRSALEKLLGLKKFEGSRINYLTADVRDWFPHNSQFTRGQGPESLASLWLSRLPLGNLPRGTMSDERRCKGLLESGGPRIVAINSAAEVPSEEGLVSYLALLADGLGSPKTRYEIRDANGH